MVDILIPPSALEAGARAMAKAGYAFSGIELTDPYTADADYWDCCTRAAFLAIVENWEGTHLGAPWVIGVPNATSIILPLPQEASDDQ